MQNFDERFLKIDTHGTLKIPFELWLAIFFMARYWLFFIAALIYTNITARIGTDFFDANFYLTLCFEFCILLLIFSGYSRHPKGGRFARFIWKNGFVFLIFSGIGHLYHLTMHLVQHEYWNHRLELFLISCFILDAVSLYSIHTSTYLKSIFKEFPSSENEK